MSEALIEDIRACLDGCALSAETMTEVLRQVLVHFDCVTGTVHSLDPDGVLLSLRAQQGIPESILPHVASIPLGKGMAGLAAERRAPVQVCNLQTDQSGVARPAARETQVEGAIALPMLVEERLMGVLGIAKSTPHDFSPEETDLLLEVGGLIGQVLA